MESRAYMLPSQMHDWATPQKLFDELWEELGPFDLDPCGQSEVHYAAWKIANRGGRCMDGSTGALDGLLREWNANHVYMNPPYGRAIIAWVKKAAHEVECGNARMVVALLPVRTDTKWWQTYVMQAVKRTVFGEESGDLRGAFIDRATMQASQVRFLPGRLKFGDSKNSAPFPSAIVVWGQP